MEKLEEVLEYDWWQNKHLKQGMSLYETKWGVTSKESMEYGVENRIEEPIIREAFAETFAVDPWGLIEGSQ